ncbi:MAG TPA: DUF3566 domain-containing protein [Acidimicrobiales bacterium]|nr:DUF3566 domain-containing protein [Acidimicrobiales bacterium]
MPVPYRGAPGGAPPGAGMRAAVPFGPGVRRGAPPGPEVALGRAVPGRAVPAGAVPAGAAPGRAVPGGVVPRRAAPGLRGAPGGLPSPGARGAPRRAPGAAGPGLSGPASAAPGLAGPGLAGGVSGAPVLHGPSPAPVQVRRKVVRDVRYRHVVRRLHVWSVLKVSLLFYLCVLLVLLVAGAVLWDVASAAGVVRSLDKLVRSLFALSSFQLHPLTALAWGTAVMGGLCLIGVFINVLAAVLYNLISDIVGGVEVTVVNDQEPSESRAPAGSPSSPPARPS